MIRIRNEQKKALAAGSRKDFEDRMVAHIRKFFPKHYEQLKEENTRLLVDHEIERAKTYGIVAERDVCKYIDLSLVFGPDFDADGKQPWATEILTDKRIDDPSYRTDRLFRAGLAHLKESHG
ncbi:MAG: hypothetical protein MUE73_16220 [Planctomycetes bacterium]|jgi:hypothetical protein|nr:hypothetical protein [Planctomycetota bacterium]